MATMEQDFSGCHAATFLELGVYLLRPSSERSICPIRGSSLKLVRDSSLKTHRPSLYRLPTITNFT